MGIEIEKEITQQELLQMYNTNEEFKHYVDECRKYDNRTAKEELELKSVKYKALDMLGKLHFECTNKI